MVLDRILDRLRLRSAEPRRPHELGQLGYIEWLASLPGDSDFNQQAMIAYERARPFRRSTPAIAVFCDLLVAATRMPIAPLDLSLPHACRRGGARARRQQH